MSKYPECEKLSAVKDKSQIIGEFLEWASYSGYQFTKTTTVEVDEWKEGTTYEREHQIILGDRGIGEALAEFFEIDLDKVEAEQRQMMEEITKANGS